MNEELLPLFPLRVVLFPGASLPLHIFEERYKVMIRECLEGDREFGVNCVSENELQSVGCTAKVTSVLRTYEDGRMDIVVTGGRRYTLTRFETGRAPYFVGHVLYLPLDTDEVDTTLAGDTIRLYNALVLRVYKDTVPQIEAGRYESGVSYIMAQKAGMDLLQRQQVLETATENARLQLVNAYLIQALPKLDRLEEIERVIQCDGYL